MNRRQFLVGLAALGLTPLAQGGVLDTLSHDDAIQVLHDSLTHSARAALDRLGKADGFLANPRVRIGLHKNLVKAERLLRSMGQGRKLDDLVRAMNRAAEHAIPKVEPMVLGAIRKMSVDDAKGILGGGSDSATAWFRKTTEAQLAAEFMPVIHGVAEKSDLVRAHNALSRTLAQWNIYSDLSTLEAYVNHKALDGFYAVVAEEESELRKNPARLMGELAARVFGELRR